MMKHFFTHIALTMTLLFAFSCGEDRTYQLEERTEHNHWMLEQMRDYYLWADSLTDYEPEWKDFFAKPADFMGKLSKKADQDDKWSFVEVDTIRVDAHSKGHFNHLNSYGFDFVVMNDPTGMTTKQYFRVTTVYKNSPAERAGLKRNDFISNFDSYKVSDKNANKLEKGLARKLTVWTLMQGEEELVWGEKRTLDMEPSEYVEDEAFPVSCVLDIDETKVGYLMCSRLSPYPSEQIGADEKLYINSLDRIMSEMKRLNVDEMVLDLRLCNDGTIEMAHRLASCIVNPIYINNVFLKTEWNKNHSEANENLFFDKSATNLSLKRIYILTSKLTQGAAEWLIYGLQGAMGKENVYVIGKETAGQTVMTKMIGYEHKIHLNPAVAYVLNANGDKMEGSIIPDRSEDELSYALLYEYGDPNEMLLRIALSMIDQ